MGLAAGTITIEFVATESMKKLLEDFPDYFVKYGKVKLTNMNGEVVTLDIHNHEFNYFDEESEDEESGDEEFNNGDKI